jgi:hypothetical protein
MTMLESFAGWLRFCFNTNEKSMFLEDTMDSSPGTGKVKLVLIRRAPHAGYFSLSRIIRRSSDGDIARGDRFGPVFFGCNPFSGS